MAMDRGFPPTPVSPFVMPRSDPLDPVFSFSACAWSRRWHFAHVVGRQGELKDLLDGNRSSSIQQISERAGRAGPWETSASLSSGIQDVGSTLGDHSSNVPDDSNGQGSLRRRDPSRGAERRGRSRSPEVLSYRTLGLRMGLRELPTVTRQFPSEYAPQASHEQADLSAPRRRASDQKSEHSFSGYNSAICQGLPVRESARASLLNAVARVQIRLVRCLLGWPSEGAECAWLKMTRKRPGAETVYRFTMIGRMTLR